MAHSAKLPIKGLAAAIGAISVFSFTGGITFPLLAYVLQRHGASPTFIGMSGAMLPLGIILGSFLAPLLARRFGAITISASAFVAVMVIILGLALSRNFWLWFPLRFALGVAVNFMFVFSETWINQLAPPAYRGRIMGLYVTMSAIGFCLGPLLLVAVGSEGMTAFTVAMLSPLVALPLLWAARKELPDGFDDHQGGGFFKFARAAPVLLLLVAIIALYDQTILALFPVYGLSSGLSEWRTSLALSVAIFGNVVLQLPLGWAADRYNRRAIALGLGIATACGFLILPVVITGWLSWPVLFFIGAAGFGGFTIAMVELGENFSGSMLLAGNASFAIMWGLGGLVGPPVAGAAMDIVGAQGFAYLLASLYGILVICLALWPFVRTSNGPPPR